MDNDLRRGATQLVRWGSDPALVTRVSIPNVNLLSTKGSILYGTGNAVTKNATINENTYQYAEVKALSGVGVEGASISKSVLFNDGDGNLSWTELVDNLTTGNNTKVLSAKAGNYINERLYLTGSKATGSGGLALGSGAQGSTNAVALGNGAQANAGGTIAIGNLATVNENTLAAIAIGNNAKAEGSGGAVALGNGAQATVANAIQLGYGTNEMSNSFQVFNTPMLVDGKIPLGSLSPTITVNDKTGLVLSSGQIDKTMSYDGTVVLGPQAVVTGQEGVAIGKQAVVIGSGVAIGGGNVTANGSGVAIGAGAEAGIEGIAIGSTTFAGENSIAIGDLAEAADETIQLGQFKSTFLFRVGNYEVMGKDGQIPGQRLTNALSSINKRLDDLGFKEGEATYIKSGGGTTASVEENITVQTNSLQKMGKWCIFNFKVHMEGARGVTRSIGIIVPSGFRPKTDTIIKLGGADTTIKSTGVIDTISWTASSTGASERDFVYYNAWWELP